MKMTVILLMFQIIFSQVNGQLKGKIVNEDGEPIEGVYIFSYRSQFKHTFSDREGVFAIYFEKRNTNCELLFYSANYADTLLTVTPSDSLIYLKLSKRAAYERQHIAEIEDAGIVNVVENAIEDLSSKVPTSSHQLSAFLRVISTNKGFAVGLMEASIRIDDPGYSSKKPVAIVVDQLRVSMSRDSSLVMPVRIKNPFISFNPVYRAYESSHVRLIRKHGTVLSSSRDFVKDTNFFIVRHVRHDSNNYVEVYFEKSAGTFSENGFLRINAQNKSIKEYKRTLFTDDEVIDEIELKLARRDDAYYPTYIRTYQIAPNLIPGVGKTFTYNISELFIERNDIRTHGIHIEPREPMPFAGRYVYNPDFWENYNMLKKHPISGDTGLLFIEWTKDSMEKEFIANSK
ncbi:MAG: hypothetical protein KIT62_10450 [Cyclobacteriaceae bacterium]|nr:hypothetical protein [Cyclobacteriaceae bacterium]